VTEPDKRLGVRTFLEQETGLTLDDEQIARVEEVFGVPIDDEPGRWDDVERNILAWAAKRDPLEASSIVQPCFERLLDEATLAATTEGPIELLPHWTPGERAIIATRVIEGEIGNGGLHVVFDNEEAHLLGPAVEGYRLLGIDDHADLLQDILTAGFSGKEEDGDANEFHGAWFSLRDAEAKRAAYIDAHPSDFRT
jgi:hypothetical protein